MHLLSAMASMFIGSPAKAALHFVTYSATARIRSSITSTFTGCRSRAHRHRAGASYARGQRGQPNLHFQLGDAAGVIATLGSAIACDKEGNLYAIDTGIGGGLFNVLDDGYAPLGGAGKSLARRLPSCAPEDFWNSSRRRSSMATSTTRRRTLGKPGLRGSGRRRKRASGVTGSLDAAS